MNQFTFCFTEKELKEFSIRAVLELYRRRRRTLVFLLLLCVAESFINPLFGLLVLILSAAALGIDILRTCRFMKKEKFLEKRVLRVEDGLLKSSAAGAGEIPCSRIDTIVKTKNLLMLGCSQSKRQIAWYPLPRRVFENDAQLEEFLALFSGGAWKDETWNTGRTGAGAVFSFAFWMDEEKWIRVYRDALMTVNSGTLGFPQNMKTFLGVYGVIFVLAGVLWFFITGDHTLIFPLVLLLMYLYLMLYKWKADPEKSIDRQLKSGNLQSDIYGGWEVHLMEEGIVQIVQGRSRTFFKWEEFGWLVETDSVFYLFKKNKIQFLPILKEGIGSYEQAGAMCRFCESKGISGTGGKKQKYLPGWFFAVGFALMILLLFLAGMWIGYYRDIAG